MNKLYTILFLTLLLCNNIYGQRWISGQVTFANGEPAHGVQVMVRGANLRTTTDFDGNYRIEIDTLRHRSLSFLFAGFDWQEIRIGNDSIIDVRLEEEAILLDEFTIIEFTHEKRGRLPFSHHVEYIYTRQRMQNFRIQREAIYKQTISTSIGTRVEYVNVSSRRTIRNFRIQRELVSREITHISGPTKHEESEHIEQQHQERQRQRQSMAQRQFAGEGLQIPSLSTFIMNNIRYPVIAIEHGIQGRVFARFSFDSEGNVADVEIVRGVDRLLDREVVRIIQSTPRLSSDEMRRYVWGYYRSTPPKFILPVNFRLISDRELDNLRQNQQ